MDRFTFMPGDLVEITDPKVLEADWKRDGFVPPSDEEWAWVSAEAKRRYDAGLPVDTQDLQDEYKRLKAEGKL
jgi:hypothetical protein